MRLLRRNDDRRRVRGTGAAALLLALGLHPLGAAERAGAAPGPAVGISEEPLERIAALLGEDRWREALAEARGALDRHPGDPAVIALLGRALFRAGRFEEADRLLTPLAEAPDSRAWSLLTLARLRHAGGRGAESAALLRRALEQAPEDRDLLYWAADIAPGRRARIDLLQRYLARSEGDDPDRIEDARGTIRVLEPLGDRRVWNPVERPDRLELPLRHVWDESGATIGYVLIGFAGEKEKPVRLLLDTGNPGLYVIRRVARKRGFTELGESTTFGGGGDRRHRVQRGLFGGFALGGLRYDDALVTSQAGELDPTGRFHGLIGLAAFAGYRITIDLENKRLLAETAAEPLDGVPYWVVAGQILVRAGASGGESALFLLDTGATRSVLADSYAERLEDARLGEPGIVQGLGGRYAGARTVSGVRLEFDGVTGEGPLHAADLSVRSRTTGVEIAGYLGLEILDGARIVIDTRSQTLRVHK